jgi:hypothetical protein
MVFVVSCVGGVRIGGFGPGALFGAAGTGGGAIYSARW